MDLGFVHRLVQAPGQSRRTLVLLHGTGGDESDLLPLGRALDSDATLLGIRGKVMEGPMPRFFRRLEEGVFDEEDLVFRTHELADFLRKAVAAYDLDALELVAVGYSNGANIAASLLLLEPNVLAHAVLLRSMVPVVPAQLPNLAGRKVFMASGLHDPILPADNAQRLADMLKQAGAEVDLQWSNAGHGLLQHEVEQARSFVASLG
ncbi:alpha/beta hydrolase [Alicyclobacillus sp. ALC3]|uniref:alpha/beta hydrolase n=1 Tax=Alicyclobacillus sp. ALC3 TaxID=2796143 RepID=UPI002379DBBA|nr:alpha/beta hydrolase [Alicyclobacillus sp. ALC3]WDL99489.1 alpha/beta hydrolase [Alicyclobacillus sp. ALC3]